MKKRLLGMLMLTFLIGGGSLFTLAEDITVVSKDFPLGTNVVGKWNKDKQTLTMTGQGKINKAQWDNLVSELGLKNQGTEEVKINFWKEVQFPNDASEFFRNFQSKFISFDPAMDTSNVIIMKAMFKGAVNFNTDISAWNTEKVTDMIELFQDAENFNQPLKDRNTSQVTSMRDMFNGAKAFNQPLTNWKTQKVKNMTRMFFNAESFNSDVSGWDLSNAENLSLMFQKAKKFNQPLTTWKTSEKLQNLAGMFDHASAFNQEVAHFVTKNVTNLNSTFAYSAFNKDISNWNVANVTGMHGTFAHSKFVGDISDWDVRKVITMNNMFAWTAFNGNLSKRKTESLTDMRSMFQYNQVFNQDLGNFDTSKVTDMALLFADAEAFEGKGVKNWNVEKVKNMEQTFNNAFAFNADLSNWNPKALENWLNFINLYTQNNSPKKLSFSRENYDKLLKSWNEKLTTEKPKFTLTIEAPYCLGKDARDSLRTKGYDIQKDRRDCELEASKSENKESKTSIKSTVTISSVLPADKIRADISKEKTKVTYKDWKCETIKKDSPSIKECSFEVTSTEGGRFLEISYTDRVSKKIRTGTYLIDNQGPQLPQVTIDTKDPMENTTITLKEFPQDIWGAGVAKCHIWYTNSENNYVNYDILDNQLPRTSSIKALDQFVPDDQGVYTLTVRCEDKLWNEGDKNIVKFPPIIDFSTENKTIIKKDETFTGSFTIYSPSGKDIDEISPDRTWNIGLSKITCKGTKDPNQSWELSEANRKISNMAGKNDKEHKITCSYEGKGKETGTLKIEAKDTNNARGQSSQSFTLDNHAPSIRIEPNQAISSGNIELTITITDSIQLNTGSITIEGQPLNLDTCTEKKSEKLVCSYTITGPVKDKTITVTAQDAAGHKTTTESWTFTIDTEAPSITDPQMTYGNSGTLAKITFTAQDTGVGLRTKTDQENTVLGFDWNAISYGFSENASCNNYQQEAILNPGMAEPFKLSFELTDSNHNGKYVCVQVKDKVWNLTSASLGQLKINQAPTLENSSATIAENLTVGSTVLTLAGNDPGDTLRYKIVSWNTGSVFKIEDNELKVDGILDYEALKSYALEIRVTDPQGLSTTAQVIINLTDVDEDKPSIKPIADLSYTTNATITPIVLSGTDNNGITEWTVEGLPAGLSFDKDHLTIKGTLTAEVGNYPITVTAKDAEGNTTTLTFTLKVINRGYSGGGGGRVLNKKAEKPSTNEKKPESSDKAQTPVGEKKAYQENDLFNPNIEDGKCYTRRPHLGILTSQLIPTTEEYNKAQSFLWSYEMTKYDSVDSYDPYRYLSRQEAAKIFSNFAINVLCRQPNKKLTVNYSDTQDADPSLKPYIELAYQLGIMKGSGQGDGSFRPYEFISKAEVNAVLIRMLLKSYLDETGMLRYTPYNQTSHTLNIISQEAGLEPIARNHVALMLFRAYKQQSFDWKEIDYFSYVLKNRADFVK